MGEIWLVRHSETEWSKSGQHTGRTDIPLTESGREHAKALVALIGGHEFARVFSSPLSRAVETCRLAGLGDRVETDPNLLEWDYGAYEGRTTHEIRKDDPAWTIWDGPTLGGETPAEVGSRGDRFIARATEVQGDVVAFAHGHILRILTARYLGLDAKAGRLFALDSASVSVLAHEHETRVVRRWNERPEDFEKESRK